MNRRWIGAIVAGDAVLAIVAALSSRISGSTGISQGHIVMASIVGLAILFIATAAYARAQRGRYR